MLPTVAWPGTSPGSAWPNSDANSTKTRWRGGRLDIADRWYPSSKTCSDCGAVKTTLRLSERMFRCEQCPVVLDRDLNAARNLAPLVEQESGGTSSPSLRGRR
jgi:putative transposase